MFCGHCGAEVAEEAPYCRACGAPKAGQARASGSVTLDADVYPILAAANLARVRRQFAEAAATCLEVLRHQPRNPTAHSLLGDIYRDQGKPRDAIEWYKQALELDPQSSSDRKKLDQLRDQVYTGPGPRGQAGSRSGPPLVGWIVGRVRSELARPVRLAMAASVVLLVLILVFLLALRATTAPPASAQATDTGKAAGAPVPTAARSLPAAPAPSTPPKPSASTPPAVVLPPPPPEGLRLARPGAPRGAGLAAREARLLGALRATSIQGERPRAIDSVWIDPRNQAAIIDFRAPERATPTDTKRNLIMVALALSQAARQADSALAVATLRGALPVPDPLGKKATEYVFVAEIDLQSLPGAEVPLTPDQALGRFSNVWWHSLYADLVP